MRSRFGGVRLLTVVIALGFLLPPTTATGAVDTQVTGWLDLTIGGENAITVVGWVADPDSDQPANVHVYVDGQFAVGGRADLRRPDVDRVTGLGEFHGFELEFDANAGSRNVCVYGIDRTTDPNKLLGCQTVQVEGDFLFIGSGSVPEGWLDWATAHEDGVEVRGWALDPDATDPIGVHVYVDGRFHSGFRADASRPDVGRVFGLGDEHGFRQNLAIHAGWHRVCLYGIDRTGDTNALIDCADVAVPFSKGAVVVESGVVLPVLETNPDGWLVFTPCTEAHHIAFDEATFVREVDVVLDPGHGGSESGAAAHGLVEKSLNLDISFRVAERLEAAGYEVLLTRHVDYRLPLKTRGAIAQGVGSSVFVSIHHNGGATKHLGHPGTMTLYQHDLPESQRLATLLWDEMFNEALKHPTNWVAHSLSGASSRLSEPDRDFYGVHRYTPGIPSVITEWGYMTNSYEADQLKTEIVKDAEADSIARAIIKWFETDETGSRDLGSWLGPGSSSTGGTDGCEDPPLP